MVDVPRMEYRQTRHEIPARHGLLAAQPGARSWTPVLAMAALTIATVVGVLARLPTSSALWLDEALSVNIAALPPAELLAALRHDGSPPLYFLALHAWAGVFGDGNGAVRALSSLFSIAALPLAYVIGRRIGGTLAGHAAVVLFAINPFLVRYATETRMYSLVVFLTLLATLSVFRARDVASWPRLIAVSVVSGALALTHYWSGFFLMAM